MCCEERIGRDNQAGCFLLQKKLKSGFELRVSACATDNNALPEPLSGRTRGYLEDCSAISLIDKYGNDTRIRQQVMHKLDQLCHQLCGHKSYTRHISTGPIERRDEPFSNRVLRNKKQDWDGLCRGLGCKGRGQVAGRHEHIHASFDQLVCKSRQTLRAPFCIAIFDCEVLPLDIAKIGEAFLEVRKIRHWRIW